MKKEIVMANNAPAALGPYSHANVGNGFVFVSGQIGIDPATGKLLDTLEAQAEQMFLNMKTILEASGSCMEEVVKTTVFVTDMKRFADINKIYAKHFTVNFPARSCIEVGALPGGALVEMEAVALKK